MIEQVERHALSDAYNNHRHLISHLRWNVLFLTVPVGLA